MKRKTILLSLWCALTAASCTQLPSSDDAGSYAARMNASGARYTACVTAEAEKDAKNSASAEDIAVAAHGRCWSDWDHYRAATNASFLQGATTRAEVQLARDKADAHLRQFERENRRELVDRIAERSLLGRKNAP
jgi:hypothetical protein